MKIRINSAFYMIVISYTFNKCYKISNYFYEVDLKYFNALKLF